jgi:hypothetical protein
VEQDFRHRLAGDAQIGEAQLRHGSMTTVDSVLDYLVSRSYGSADRLLSARDLLGANDHGARALLLRASRRAADPIPAGPPKPFSAPDAPLTSQREMARRIAGHRIAIAPGAWRSPPALGRRATQSRPVTRLASGFSAGDVPGPGATPERGVVPGEAPPPGAGCGSSAAILSEC